MATVTRSTTRDVHASIVADGFAFVAAATAVDPGAAVSSAVYAVAIGTLVVLAVVSLFTGFKVAFLPFRLCPLIFGVSAALIAWGAWL